MSIEGNFFSVLFTTSKGNFTVKAHEQWAPLGYERFHTLVKQRFFDDTRFFRVKPNYVAQFGVSGDPKISRIWKGQFIQDEPVIKSNVRGTIAYAMDDHLDSRTTQIYINCSDNLQLDLLKFAPFAEVVEGMEVVESLYSGYGERFRDQDEIEEKGNLFLDAEYPLLDRIVTAELVIEPGNQCLF
jgi:cyclophilin family peptidyl-prolyl cis-trans isomerase